MIKKNYITSTIYIFLTHSHCRKCSWFGFLRDQEEDQQELNTKRFCFSTIKGIKSQRIWHTHIDIVARA